MVQKVESPTRTQQNGGGVNRCGSVAKQIETVTGVHKGHAYFGQYPHTAVVYGPICYLFDHQAKPAR